MKIFRFKNKKEKKLFDHKIDFLKLVILKNVATYKKIFSKFEFIFSIRSGRVFVAGNYLRTNQETFVDQSPNYIAVSHLSFGQYYVVFLSSDGRIHFDRFDQNEEMIELKSEKVKMMSHYSANEDEGNTKF